MVPIETLLSKLNLYDIINILSFLVVFYFYLNGKKSLPYFGLFLFILIFLEVYLQVYWSYTYKYNIFIYNIISKYTIVYYTLVYYNYFRNKPWSGWIQGLFFSWLVICVFMNSYEFDTIKFDKLSYIGGLIFISGLIFMYFYDIIYIKQYKNIMNDSLFYLSVGIIIFFAANFPILVFVDLFITNTKKGSPVYSNFIQLGNIFLSLGYLGASLCSKK